MERPRLDSLTASLSHGFSRRTALRRLGAGGIAAGLLSAVGLRSAAAQSATPMAAPAGWRSMHLEVEVLPMNPVTITRADAGPPQRGDFFHIDAPIFASGDLNGTEIGRYQCFGVWTHAASDKTATDLRFTTVQFRFADGAIMGLINEGGKIDYRGAVQGGTGKYAAAMGTFDQVLVTGPVPGVATPGAAASGTPAAPQSHVHTLFDLLLPAA